MINKKIIILVLCLAVMTVVSGCVKKEVKTVIETSNKQKTRKVEEQKYQENEIIDISTSTDINYINLSDWTFYQNSFYNCFIKYPIQYKFCLDDFCSNVDNFDSDSIIQHIEIFSTSLDYKILKIIPLKNNLRETAIEFGRKMKVVNEQKGYYISNSEKKIIFAGQLSYSFEVEKEFVQNGAIIEYSKYNNKKIMAIKHGNGHEGILLTGKHKIIYFDKDELIYRIIYPIDDDIAKRIIHSFKFIK